MNKEALEMQFDTYIKKTITNTVINYKKYETRKKRREISLECLMPNDVSVPFLCSFTENLEDYFENEKLYSVVARSEAGAKRGLRVARSAQVDLCSDCQNHEQK